MKGEKVGKGKGRRRQSNHRLPTFTDTFATELVTRRFPLLRLAKPLVKSGLNTAWSGTKTTTRALKNRWAVKTGNDFYKKRQLANKKSSLPRTIQPATQTGRSVERSLNQLRQDVCVGRQIRKEVIHAIGRSGQGGQKTPKWTKKSKIRC